MYYESHLEQHVSVNRQSHTYVNVLDRLSISTVLEQAPEFTPNWSL